MVKNLNEALPIKNYRDIVVGVRGYNCDGKHLMQGRYSNFSGEPEEALEIDDEFRRINQNIDKLLKLTNGEECNYWSQTEHFYYWTRINPKFGEDDYCVYIKAYRKES